MLRKGGHILSILVIGIFSIGIFSAFAQTQETISVTTSKKSYNEGDTIVISGQVSSIILDTQVTIQIFHEGNLVDIVQAKVAQDGKFTHTMLAKGPLWQNDGTYIVRASYGANYMVETSFKFFASKPVSEFSVKTDKSFYEDGDTITVSGFIKNLNQDYPVDLTLRVYDPTGNIVSMSSVTPKQDGTFENTLIASGTFKVGGEYSVQASYSGQKATTTFQFAGGSGYTPPPPVPAPTTVPAPEPEPESNVASLQEKIAQLEQENIELKMQIEKLQEQIVKLNELVLQQLKVIYEWVVSR